MAQEAELFRLLGEEDIKLGETEGKGTGGLRDVTYR